MEIKNSKLAGSIFNTQDTRILKVVGEPEDSDLVILCSNNGGGHKPYQCLLTHQIYKNDLEDYFKENPDVDEISVFFVKSKDNILIAKK